MCKRLSDFIRTMRPVRYAIVLFVSMSVLSASPSILRADSANAPQKPKSGIALSDEKCRVDPSDDPKLDQLLKWTEAEKWAWKRICEGQTANFNRNSWYKWAKYKKIIPETLKRETLDPKNPKHNKKWTESERILRLRFLKTILLNEPFRSAIPHRGVRIFGAYFKRGIDLEDASIERPLSIQNSLIEGRVRMSRFETSKIVSFNGSKFRNLLYMRSASIGGDLIIRRADFETVVMRGTKIDGQLDMRSSKFKGKLDMNSTSVEDNMLMRSYRLSAFSLSRFLRRLRETEMILPRESMEVFEARLKPQLKKKIDTELKEALKKKTEQDSPGRYIGRFMKKLDPELQANLMSAIIAAMKMEFRSEFKDVDLSGLKVDGFLDMNGASFKGDLLMTSASIQGDLLMSSHQLSPIKLRLLKLFRFIPRNFPMQEISGIEFKSEFKLIDLGQAKIVGALVLNGSKFQDKLNLSFASIGEDLQMQGVQLSQPATMSFLSIGSNFDARGAMLSGLELTGARIERVLRLGGFSGDKKIEWIEYKDEKENSHKPKLTLRNTNVGTLQENRNAWPENLELELDGFTYKRFETSGKDTLYERGSQWFIDWLGKGTEKQLQDNKIYSPQPYRQLARVLRADGLDDIADDILYEGREQERDYLWYLEGKLPLMPFKWWRLTFLKWAYGYGYGWRSLLVLGWVAVFVVVGTIVLRLKNENGEHDLITSLSDKAWYSLDMLLPVIHLREKHYDENFDLKQERVRYYFYVHKIMGYVLTFFLLAGLSGLME